MVLPSFVASMPVNLHKHRIPGCSGDVYVVSAEFDAGLGKFAVDKATSGGVLVLRRGSRDDEDRVVRATRLPMRMAGAFAMMCGIVNNIMKKLKVDSSAAEIEYEMLWIIAHIRERMFSAAEEAVTLREMHEGWIFRPFTHLWIHLWYGFPPTPKGTGWLESAMSLEGPVLRWDDWQCDAISLDAGRHM
jgi:hypothetical protein